MAKKARKTPIRPLGEITDELEPLMYEMVEAHKMQLHEIIGILKSWAWVHAPQCIEQYEDGSKPESY